MMPLSGNALRPARLQGKRLTLALRLSEMRQPEILAPTTQYALLRGSGAVQMEILNLPTSAVTKDLCLSKVNDFRILQFLGEAFDMPRTAITRDLCLSQANVFPVFESLDCAQISEPIVTLSLIRSIVHEQDLFLKVPTVATKLILDNRPEVLSFDMELEPPRVEGKRWQETTSHSSSGPRVLREGGEISSRSPPSPQGFDAASSGRGPTIDGRAAVANTFDLLLPILQPPLGEEFDGPFAMPQGKALYPFQRKGVRFLLETQHALLADEMGLGKSIQAIVALRVLFRKGSITSCLVVCPKSVLTDWDRKFAEWAPELQTLSVSGWQSARSTPWEAPVHVYLCTYETVRTYLGGEDFRREPQRSEGRRKWVWSEGEGGFVLQVIGDPMVKSQNARPLPQDINTDIQKARKNFDLVILDEIQRIKNPKTKTTVAVRNLRASYRWALSGTPLENSIADLISAFAFLKPGLIDLTQSLGSIRESVRPHLLRRRKQDALPELPPKVVHEVWLQLDAAQRSAYDRAENEGIVELTQKGATVTIYHVLQLIQKLKQICNLAPTTNDGCKLDFLKDYLSITASEGSKTLVFSQYPEVTLRCIMPTLGRFNPFLYHGGLNTAERDKIIDDFQENDKGKVLLMSVRSGAMGITLTRANHVVHYDLWWNPAVASQAEDRAHRIGQTKTVFVSYLLTVDTIEERIHVLLKQKQALFDRVIDSMSDGDVGSALSEEELFGLFGLRSPRRR